MSTALTEEELSKCIKRSVYESAPSDDSSESCNGDMDDIKCSVCQVFSLYTLNLFPLIMPILHSHGSGVVVEQLWSKI